MLGLTYEVGGDDMRVSPPVSKDQAISRACDHVDANTSIKGALGFCHKLVAGSDNDVGLGLIEQPKRHRGNALNPADGQDLVSATRVGRIDNGGVHSDTRLRR